MIILCKLVFEEKCQWINYSRHILVVYFLPTQEDIHLFAIVKSIIASKFFFCFLKEIVISNMFFCANNIDRLTDEKFLIHHTLLSFLFLSKENFQSRKLSIFCSNRFLQLCDNLILLSNPFSLFVNHYFISLVFCNHLF